MPNVNYTVKKGDIIIDISMPKDSELSQVSYDSYANRPISDRAKERNISLQNKTVQVNFSPNHQDITLNVEGNYPAFSGSDPNGNPYSYGGNNAVLFDTKRTAERAGIVNRPMDLTKAAPNANVVFLRDGKPVSVVPAAEVQQVIAAKHDAIIDRKLTKADGSRGVEIYIERLMNHPQEPVPKSFKTYALAAQAQEYESNLREYVQLARGWTNHAKQEVAAIPEKAALAQSELKDAQRLQQNLENALKQLKHGNHPGETTGHGLPQAKPTNKEKGNNR